MNANERLARSDFPDFNDPNKLGQGKENARSFLRDNPDLTDELEKRIKEKLGIGPRVDAPPRVLPGDDPDAIREAAALIRSGELVAFPTDSYYGLGCDLFDKRAIERIYLLKQLPYTRKLLFEMILQAKLEYHLLGIC